jgi:hypothetical protein
MLTCDDVRNELLARSVDRIFEMRSRPDVTIYDKEWENPLPVVGEISAAFEDLLNDSGQGEVKLLGSNRLNDWLLDELEDEEDVHIVVNSGGKRWSGKCTGIVDEGTENGVEFVTIAFISEYEHVKKIICYCNPLLPPEFQYPKLFALACPSVTAVRSLMFLNLLRRFAPLWALPEDLFNPQNWAENLLPENWPIVVMPGKGLLLDTSMWTVVSTRFGNLHDVVAPTLADAGLQITATRWLPGDAQPAPDHFILSKPTLLLDVIDKSGYVGPSGTILDGLLHFVQSVAADMINEVNTITNPANPPENSIPGFMGTTTIPWVKFRNALRIGKSGISSWRRTTHKATAGAIVTGGHSPDYINSGLKLLVNAVLGYIGAIFANPALGIGIFDSQITDVVLAFHRVTNPRKIAAMGIRGPSFGEHWEASGGTGFSLSALQSIRTGFWRTRAYTTYKFTAVNGAGGYWVGRHFDTGDRVSAEVGRKGKLYIDRVHSLKLTWSRGQDPTWTISIGDDKADEQPGALLARQIEQARGIAQAIGVSS